MNAEIALRADREVELKFAIDPARGAAALASLAPGIRSKPRRLVSTYFDTADQALRRAGFSLRVRREGEAWRQTVKSLEPGATRGQWEADIAGPRPETAELRRTPAASALDGADVAPLFRVEVARRSVAAREAEATIEASLDAGRAILTGTGAPAAPFAELELELKGGDPAGLFALAARLRRDFNLRPAFLAKAERGFTLMSADEAPARHWRAPPLHEAMTAGEAFRSLARAGLAQIAENAAALAGSDDPEIVHQLRVGARRLRSLLKTFAPVIADARCDGLEAELKWLAGEFDAVRDLDVLIAGRPARAAAQEGGRRWRRLRDELRRQRRAALVRARAAAVSDRLSRLLFDLVAWLEIGPWTSAAAKGVAARDRPAAAFAAETLASLRGETHRRARGFEAFGARRRHKLRIRCKRLRYASEDLAPLVGRPGRAERFVDALKALLDDLGELNDLSTAKTLLAGRKLPKALKRCAAKRKRKLLARAGRRLDVFEERRAFWPS